MCSGFAAFGTLGEAVRATGPFDLVDVFRRPEACAAHAREAVEVGARCFWLQLGVVDWTRPRSRRRAAYPSSWTVVRRSNGDAS